MSRLATTLGLCVAVGSLSGGSNVVVEWHGEQFLAHVYVYRYTLARLRFALLSVPCFKSNKNMLIVIIK